MINLSDKLIAGADKKVILGAEDSLLAFTISSRKLPVCLVRLRTFLLTGGLKDRQPESVVPS
ncbi:MAG: hypothetical protein PHU81_02445 [Acidobacteriota bacterium]|nr:hypothetical protein [Acidobacteriota bacterium]